jgi:catechol 2,3-dioxygenase-like lactoylglutathione lyase family enzyme
MKLGYATIGALDNEASGKFYDAVFGAIGGERKFTDGGWIGYGPKGEDRQDVYVITPPADGNPARAGNGIMLSFRGAAKAEVDAAHVAGLTHGGTDEGKPGPRPADSKTFYGAYLRDPTGNKICIYHKS